MDQYFELVIANVPSQMEEAVSAKCFLHGAQGVMENLKFHQMRDDYAPEVIATELIELTAYFDSRPEMDLMEALKAMNPEIKVSIKQEENKDWMEEWKKDFKAFSLSGDYWVVPSWLEAPAEAKKYLSIDPGMAFGTGTHDTTQLASSFLLEQKESAFKNLNSVLDVGTGTGILAILARKEFASQVVCTEIDDDARPVARENFAKNGCSDIELPDYQIEQINSEFDLVIANIIDGVLLKLKKQLVEKTKVGAYLILTGILEERDSAFIQDFMDGIDFEICERKSQGEWVGYLLRKMS